MSWNTSPERLPMLFELVTQEVSSAGGDGGGTVVFRTTDIQAVAVAFAEWKAKTSYPHWLPHRIDHSHNHVLFTDMSNENIVFVSKAVTDTWPPERRGIGHDEVWMEVW